MIQINYNLTPEGLGKQLVRFWELSGEKILNIEKKFDGSSGSPVYTAKGNYSTRGWTEWTQGFQYGSAILNYEATGAKEFLEIGKNGTIRKMSGHLTHMGVHDHGFNNISSYGNLLRLMKEGLMDEDQWERKYYELALKVSGAVQASRWTQLSDGGFIYSFNGPHSLFIDTIRSVRILMISHLLGQELLGEDDIKIKLMDRAFDHIRTTAKYSVYYGEGRDQYDIPGRTAHECIFNVKNGAFRSPSSQQGFSGRTTWTRGLAWAMLGFAEELEFVEQLHDLELKNSEIKNDMLHIIIRAVKATCDFYIDNTPADGIPYWDTGAPMLYKIKDYLSMPADPFNNFEPVDSSAALIAAQGLMRFGNYLRTHQQYGDPEKYFKAGLTVFNRLLSEPYLSEEPDHQGLILHSIYHQPNGWDYKPEKDKAAYGESSMWGDYHARELAIYVEKLIKHGPYYTYYNCVR